MRRPETTSIHPDIIKGYEVGKGQYIEIEPEELEAIAIAPRRLFASRVLSSFL
jgi:non-homologous end joining protein Ku